MSPYEDDLMIACNHYRSKHLL